jgi:hypothetical protein
VQIINFKGYFSYLSNEQFSLPIAIACPIVDNPSPPKKSSEDKAYGIEEKRKEAVLNYIFPNRKKEMAYEER